MNYHSVLEVLEKGSEQSQSQGDSDSINETDKANSEQIATP